jgi:hypothetical protein
MPLNFFFPTFNKLNLFKSAEEFFETVNQYLRKSYKSKCYVIKIQFVIKRKTKHSLPESSLSTLAVYMHGAQCWFIEALVSCALTKLDISPIKCLPQETYQTKARSFMVKVKQEAPAIMSDQGLSHAEVTSFVGSLEAAMHR